MRPENEVAKGFRKLAPEKHRTRPSIDKESLEALGIKSEARFNSAFDNLCKHWWDKIDSRSDTTGGRLVNNVIAFNLKNPVVLAIIADDVDVFKKHYNKKDGDIFCLELCCLCGSEKIVNDVFLQSSDMQKCLVLSKNAIGYALSSGNLGFALKLAETALKLGKTDPGQVALYSFGQSDCANTIRRMYSPIKKESLIQDAETSDKAAKPDVFR